MRPRWAIALSLFCAACAAPPPKLREGAVARKTLNPFFLKRLPEHGFVFFSGGLVNKPMRLAVDFDKKTLLTVTNDREQASSGVKNRLKDRVEAQWDLSDAEVDSAKSAAEDIWISTESFVSRSDSPPADFHVSMTLGDGESVRGIESYGQPVGKMKDLYHSMWALADAKAKSP